MLRLWLSGEDMSADERVDEIIHWMQRVQHASMEHFRRMLLDEFLEAELEATSRNKNPSEDYLCAGTERRICPRKVMLHWNGIGRKRIRCVKCANLQFYFSEQRKKHELQKATSI